MIRFASHTLLATALCAAFSLPALAHHPTCQCRAESSESIVCTGGFSDGGAAPGVTLDVIGYDEQILVSGHLDEHSQMRFKRPSGEFYILMDIGPGHVVEVDHREIAAR